MTEKELISLAQNAMAQSYSPYSGCSVGAALLCGSGRVYVGCNIENASFTPTVCAERTAFFKAVSEGERSFVMIAVAGGKNGEIKEAFIPCGVCRQVMAEFCGPDFVILTALDGGKYDRHTLSELLPFAFSPERVK